MRSGSVKFPGMWIFPLVFLVVVLLFIFRTGGPPMCGRRDTRESRANGA
jgi:putative membrane protein